MSTAKKLQITEQEYLDGERHANIKHQFIDGNAYAIKGTRDNHNRISINVLKEFLQQIKSRTCEPFIADIMLKAGSNIYYPDVMVICEADDADTSHVKHSPNRNSRSAFSLHS